MNLEVESEGGASSACGTAHEPTAPPDGYGCLRIHFPSGSGSRPGKSWFVYRFKILCIKKQGLQNVLSNNRKVYPPYSATVPHTISDHGLRRPLRADAGTGSLEGVV